MSRLKLSRPLVSFDLETTGTDIANDKIVQIAMSKIWQDEQGNFSHKDYEWLVNPGIPIPKEASEVHKIYDKDVIDKPLFEEIASTIYEIIKDSDLLGYNSNRFDVPILGEHLIKCGYLYPKKETRLIDAQVIFHEHEPRNLEAAFRKYCNKELGDEAHDASVDMKATTQVLFGQLEMYDDLPGDVDGLHEASKRGEDVVDFARKLVYNEEGEVCYNFGSKKGVRVKDDTSFAYWILDRDFPEYTKYCLREELGMPQPSIDNSDQNQLSF